LINTTDSIQFFMNPFNLRANNYGNADYDVRHSFNASIVWQTPFKFANSFLNQALGGWTIGAGIFAHSGLPTTVMDATGTVTIANNALVTNIGSPAVVLGSGQLSCNDPGLNVNAPNMCLNPSAFAPTGTNGIYSNEVRNQYRGPKFFDTDLSLLKNFKLTERFQLGAGANFYNIFNHPNFSNPDGLLGDATFGQILSTVSIPTSPYGTFVGAAASPRIIQTQIKLTF